jgi:hypothetical protein
VVALQGGKKVLISVNQRLKSNLSFYLMSYFRSYYLQNKERILANNIRYYYEHKEQRKVYHSQNYQEHKPSLLEYQKKYNKEHKKEYNTYQLSYYYNKIKNDPEKVKKRKEYQKSYRRKIAEPSVHERQIKRTELLMTKMLRELLKKVPRYENLTPDPEPILKPEPVITPFAGVKINSRGYFVLEW